MKKITSTLKLLLKQIAKFLVALFYNIFAAILIGIIGIPVLVSWVTGTLDILFQTIKSPTPLWGTIAFVLICCLYTYLKIQLYQNSHKPPAIQEELHEELGVYWNNQYKLRCLKCKWPLKCASKKHDPSIFFCSNCDTKHALRDKNGTHITEAQAIEQLKKLPTSH
jgi:hypothetical protein